MMTNVTDRINNLTVETAETWLDGASLIQKQNAAFVDAWFGAVEANQKTARDLTTRAIKQAQEAQALCFQYAQDSYRAGFEKVADLSSIGLKVAGEQVETVTRQGANNTRKAESASK